MRSGDSPQQQQLPQEPSAASSLLRGGGAVAPALLQRRRFGQEVVSQADVISRASGNSLFSTVQEKDGYTTSWVCELRKDDSTDEVPDYGDDNDGSAAVDSKQQDDILATAAKMSKIQSTVVVYDYEVVLPHPNEPVDEVIVQDFPKIELGILHRMASVAGLLDCDLRKQLSDPWMLTGTTVAGTGTTLLKQSQFLSEDNLIVGLSSYSPDDPDPVGQCEFIKNVSSDYLCVPVMGNMTAYYVGDDPKAIQDYVLHHLAIEMNEQRVKIGGIKETYFVGERYRPPASVTEDPPPPVVLSPTSSSSRSFGPLILSFSMAALFLAAAALFAAGRRRSRNGESDISSQEGTTRADKEAVVSAGVLGAFPQSASEDDANSPKSSSDEPSLRSRGPGPDVEADEGPPPPVAAITTTMIPSDHDEDPQEQSSSASLEPPSGVMEDVSVQSGGTSTIATGSSVSAVTATSATTISTAAAALPAAASLPAADLPPLPPGGPSAKTAAAALPAVRSVKKRRKKRKKKKPITTALTRTNSRENIQVMDSIQEGAEDGDGDDMEDGSSYSGSEYSWSTDETDSRPGSRDPSPVRATKEATTSSERKPDLNWV